MPEGIVDHRLRPGRSGSRLYTSALAAGGSCCPAVGRVPVRRRSAAPARGTASVAEAIRSNPSLQANAAAILTDNRLRNVRYTAAARSSDNRGWYLGTSGIGASVSS